MNSTSERKAQVDQFKQMILTDERWAYRALVVLHSKQTAHEQVSHQTVEHNKVGFSAYDAEFLTDAHDRLLKYKGLREKHLKAVQKCLTKYAGQLVRLAEEKARARA